MPLATVERSGFNKFCKIILPENLHLPSRRTLGREVNEMYVAHKQLLIDDLQNAKYVSITADLWSSHKRSFMGMTVHYLDSKTLHRISKILVCRRFTFSHTGDKIAALMMQVLREFNITHKVTSCVTDNASNFVKAFKMINAQSDLAVIADTVTIDKYMHNANIMSTSTANANAASTSTAMQIIMMITMILKK